MRRRKYAEKTFHGFVACLDQLRELLGGQSDDLQTVQRGALERIAVWVEHDRIDDKQANRLRDYVSKWDG